MKRSHASSCSSSSSSSVGFETPIQSEKRRPKHPRRNVKSQQCKQNQTTGRRSSIYRGVTRHRWTGRFEAHLWDKSTWNSIQNKKGRQVYLGAYDTEEAAARTYDLAALKYWGKDATLNFQIETYSKDLEEMEKVTKEEFLAALRRQSSGFSRGVSKYRGVARHHHNGRWEARIGRVCGNKYLYLGTYKTQEEAAVAYDMAAIEHRGLNAVTNFDISNYIDKIKMKNEQSQEAEAETQTETAPSSIDSEEAEVEQKNTPPEHLHHEPQQQPQVQNTNVVQSEESSPVIPMDHVFEQDLPWNFMDTNLSQFQDIELGMNKAEDMLGMFDGAGFEEDIDFLFNTEPGESDFNLSAVLDSINCADMDGAAGSMVDNNKQGKILSSAASSPSSTTTTVSCNYVL